MKHRTTHLMPRPISLKRLLAAVMITICGAITAHSQDIVTEADTVTQQPAVILPADTVASSDADVIKRVLFVGDSMTGWMAERLNAYGNENDFEVATIVWDGSTISKWSDNSSRLAEWVDKLQPDAVFISLGLNELFDADPSRMSEKVDRLVKAVGDRDLLWIGPPSWPGHREGEKLCRFLGSRLGEKNFFDSFSLQLPRQSKSNPHPTRQGIIDWIDEVVEWIPGHTDMHFKSLDTPSGTDMSRGKTFIYKRMKDRL